MYKQKYLKYKTKYLKLKSHQSGGAIQKGGETILKEGDTLVLYCTEYTAPSGAKIYYCFEKFDETNQSFWRKYRECADSWAKNFRLFCRDAPRGLTFPNQYIDLFGWDENTFEKYKSYVLQKKWDSLNNPFKHIGGGTTGFSNVATLIPDYIKYVSYFSTIPIDKRHSDEMLQKEMYDKNLNEYNSLFGHIIMSVMFITKNNFPIVCHFGIFKNPVHFFDFDNSYGNLSISLHAMTAKMGLTFFEGKQYMINSPVTGMQQILAKKLDSSMMSVGTNQDLTRKHYYDPDDPDSVDDDTLLKTFPPRIYIDQNNIWNIVKKGTNLLDYLTKPVPQELIEYTGGQDKLWNLGGTTIGNLDTMIDLDALSKAA